MYIFRHYPAIVRLGVVNSADMLLLAQISMITDGYIILIKNKYV